MNWFTNVKVQNFRLKHTWEKEKLAIFFKMTVDLVIIRLLNSIRRKSKTLTHGIGIQKKQ